MLDRILDYSQKTYSLPLSFFSIFFFRLGRWYHPDLWYFNWLSKFSLQIWCQSNQFKLLGHKSLKNAYCSQPYINYQGFRSFLIWDTDLFVRNSKRPKFISTLPPYFAFSDWLLYCEWGLKWLNTSYILEKIELDTFSVCTVLATRRKSWISWKFWSTNFCK